MYGRTVAAAVAAWGMDGVAWILIGIIAAAAAALMADLHLRFDWQSAGMPLAACAGMVALAAFYTIRRPDPRLATALTGTAQLVAFSAAAATLSYAAAASAGPLWDGTFAGWDRALGLDWCGYLSFVEAHPWLRWPFNLAYRSIMPQLIVLTAVSGLSGRLAACREFVLAVVVAGAVTVAASAFVPAMSMYVHLGLAARDAPGLDTGGVFAPVAPLLGLRDGTITLISLTGAEGIIAFPSFHAALAVILAAVAWRLPPVVRWPGLALNLLMLASTPVNGGHYFVDVLAGVFVALCSLPLARALDRLAGRAPSPLLAADAPRRPVGLAAET